MTDAASRPFRVALVVALALLAVPAPASARGGGGHGGGRSGFGGGMRGGFGGAPFRIHGDRSAGRPGAGTFAAAGSGGLDAARAASPARRAGPGRAEVGARAAGVGRGARRAFARRSRLALRRLFLRERRIGLNRCNRTLYERNRPSAGCNASEVYGYDR